MEDPRGPTPDADLVGGGGDGDERPRPRPGLRRGVLAVVLAVAALAYGPELVASSGLSRLLAAGPGSAPSAPAGHPPPSTSPAAMPAPAPTSGPMSWPARGELAGSDAFDAEIRRSLDPSIASTAHPLWAGVVAGGRLVLVAVPADTPAGVEVLALRFGTDDFGIAPQPVPVMDNADGDAPPTVVGWLGPRGAGEGRTLFLLGPPELGHFHVSDEVEFRTDGTARRQWRVVETAGGQATLLLRRTRAGLVVVRTRTGAGAGQLLVATKDEKAPPPVRIAGLEDPWYRGPAPGLVDVSGLAARVGGARQASVLWSGGVGGTYRAVVVSLVSRKGAAFDYWQVSGPAGSDALVGGVFLVPRAAARTYPVPVLLPGADGGPGEHWLVVSPAGGGRVDVVERGRVLARLPLDSARLAVVPAQIDLRDADHLVVRGKDGRAAVTAPLARILDFDLSQLRAVPS